MKRTLAWGCVFATAGAMAGAACSSSDSSGAGAGGETSTSSASHSSSSGGSSSSASPASSSTGDFTTAGTGGSGGSMCTPPDMLITLDRTLTMHFTPDGATPTDAPDYASSKWAQAITAINALVAPPLDATIRFGLELWPKEETGCITLAERVEDTVQATNPSCESGEVLVPPALSTSSAIHGLLDPTTTKICTSTPTGAGLLTGQSFLQTTTVTGRDQYMMLVTDGADWNASCPTPDPVMVTKQIAASGIKTFILGFSATMDVMNQGIGTPYLNNMACAGQTATDFSTNCQMAMDGSGYEAVDATNGPRLFLQASDEASLSTAIQSVAASICCDCVK